MFSEFTPYSAFKSIVMSTKRKNVKITVEKTGNHKHD